MPEKREIRASHFVRDIRAGMTTSQLMRKYQLSARECQNLYGQIEEVIPDPNRLYGRMPTYGEDDTDSSAKRLYPRHDLALPLSVLNIRKLDKKGLVLDIAIKGLKTQGIDSKPMAAETLVIMANELFDIGPVVVDAQCRWAKRQGLHGTWIAGFQITDISKRNLDDLVQLIEKVDFINRRGSGPPAGHADAAPAGSRGPQKIVWVCPACEMPQSREYEECPQCGVIVSKYLAYLDGIKDQLRQSMEKVPHVTKKVSIPADVWAQIEAQRRDANQVISEALDFYLRSKKMTRTALWPEP